MTTLESILTVAGVVAGLVAAGVAFAGFRTIRDVRSDAYQLKQKVETDAEKLSELIQKAEAQRGVLAQLNDQAVNLSSTIANAVELDRLTKKALRVAVDLDTAFTLDAAQGVLRNQDYTAAKELAEGVLDGRDASPILRARAAVTIGYALKRLGDVEGALEYQLQAIALLREDVPGPLGDYMRALASYNAACYAALQGDFGRAEVLLKEALHLRPQWVNEASQDEDLAELRETSPEAFHPNTP